MRSILLSLIIVTAMAGSACAETTVYAFKAFYCPFCWMAEPGIRKLEKSDLCTVKRVNANVDKELAETYSIEKVPTLVVVEDGKETFRAVGGDSAEEVIKFLESK